MLSGVISACLSEDYSLLFYMFAFYYQNLQSGYPGYRSKEFHEIRMPFIDVKWSSNFRKGFKKFLDFHELVTSKNHEDFFRRLSGTLRWCFNWQIRFYFVKLWFYKLGLLLATFQVTFLSKIGEKSNILRMGEIVYSDITKLSHYWLYRNK